MATKQITTWDEFKTALTETITENTTYEIMNDIDVSDTIINSAISIPYNNTYKKTIQPTADKENIKINGITSYSSNTIFGFSHGGTSSFTCLEFINIHFSNFNLINNVFMTIQSFGGGVQYKFTSCLFNGICHQFAYNSTSMNSGSHDYGSITLERCSINIATNIFSYHGSGNGTYLRLLNCYIIFDERLPITRNNAIMNRAAYKDTYIGGKIKCTASSPFTISNYLGTNLCFNAYVENNSTTATTISSPGNSLIVNGDRLPSNQYSTTITNVWILTDSQIKSYSYLSQNTNFPIAM